MSLLPNVRSGISSLGSLVVVITPFSFDVFDLRWTFLRHSCSEDTIRMVSTY